MKKYIVLLLMLLCLCGCGNKDNVVNKFKNKINKSNSYLIKGTLTINSNEDTFVYKIESGKSKDGYYKVDLINNTNDHEQIILKNEDGVFVVTPSLNKSFKFQSDWPNNGSQSYLLDRLVNDVEEDDSVHISNEDDLYIQCKVNYPNNDILYSEKIYLDKNNSVKKVEVLDEDGNVKILFEVKSINYKPKFDDDYFKLNNYVSESKDEETNLTLEDIIYPLYVPLNTKLNTEDTINTDNGTRAILTFSGDSPFVLVEEVSRYYDEMEIIPVNGDPIIIGDSIGAISTNSLYWTSNNVDYYLSSTSIGSSELKTIAEGLTGTNIIVSSEK